MKQLLISTLLITSFSLTACGGGGSNDSYMALPVVDNATDTSVLTVDDSGNTNFDTDNLQASLDGYDLGEISADEEAGMLLMREEEKLAYDVYRKLFDLHGQKIFENISNSEYTHKEAMLALLERYNITDPIGDNAAGVYTNTDLQMAYDSLVAQGTPTLLDALFVGAAIEEMDIFDIENLKTQVVDNDDIIMVYDNLLKGSRNHMRSFNKQIVNAGASYEPIYITQEQYDEIVNSDMEKGD